MTKLTNPVPLFLDARGSLLDAGRIWIGVPGANPVTSPINVFWEPTLAAPAVQPLRTMGGAIVNGGSRAFVFMAEADYSLRVENADGVLVDYIPSTAVAAVNYQPEDADLTAIAALATTPFGRGLLTLANQAALKAAVGVPDALSTSGGSVSGNITRRASGPHLYHVNADYTSGRVFGPEYTTDPTTAPGDLWFKPNG